MKRLVLFTLLTMIFNIASHSQTFTAKTIENVDMIFKIISSEDKSVQVGDRNQRAIDTQYSGPITIPPTIHYNGEEYTIIAIGNSAFNGCKGLTSIEIPTSVTSVGFNAFYLCTGLSSIKIPNSVTNIGSSAFKGCENLIKVDLETGLGIIGAEAFSGCTKLESIEIPNSVALIEGYAFQDCISLKSINFPNTVTEIGGFAFFGCTGLTSIEIPSSVTKIGQKAFSNCTNISSIIVSNGNDSYDSRNNCNAIIHKGTSSLISGCKTTIIPSSVREIGSSAFFGCTGLTSIEIPSSVERIEYDAFSGCTGLTSVKIPKSVTTIRRGSFANCHNLNSLIVDSDNPYYDSRDNCNAIITKINLPNGDKTPQNTLIIGCNNTIIPASVTSIGDNAFNGCKGMTSIEIPSSVTALYSSSFQNCTAISSINVAKDNPVYDSRNNCNAIIKTETNGLIVACNNTQIPDDVSVSSAFYALSNCTKFVMPDSWEDFKFTFRDCANLEEVLLSRNISKICNSAFDGCKSLKNIEIPSGVTTIEGYAFSGCSELTSIEIPNNVTSIGTFAFQNCTSLSSIKIPNSVTSIGQYAFNNCSKLKDVVFEDGKETLNFIWESSQLSINNSMWFYLCPLESLYIGRNLNFTSTNSGQITSPFYKINTIRVVKFGEQVETIGHRVFQGCTELKSIEIPNSVTSIGSSAFEGCSSLTSVTIGNSVTSIGNSTFYNCSKLKTIVIPSSVKTIEPWAFGYCTQLDSIFFEDGQELLQFDASRNYSSFDNCPVKYIYLGRKITNSDRRFNGLELSIDLVIGKEMTTISTDALSCIRSSIKSVSLPNTVKVIESEALSNLGISTIAIPNSVEIIGASAFENCYYLDQVVIEDGEDTLKFDGIAFMGAKIRDLYLGRNINFPKDNSPFKRNREGLKTLTVGPNVTTIPNEAFLGHNGLTSLVLSEGLKKIEGKAFYGCTKIESLTIPSSVEEIEVGALGFWDGLKTLKIEDGNKELHFYKDPQYIGIGPDAFLNSQLLEEVYVGRNISFDTDRLSPFEALESLAKLSLGTQITSIPSGTFSACEKLVDVYCYPEKAPTTGQYVFTESYLPNASLHVPVTAFKEYGRSNPWNLFGRLFAIMEDGQEKEAFKVTYMLDDQEYATLIELQGNELTALDVDIPEGYTFSGWSEIPETMPAHDVTVTGSFSINSYTLTYVVDGVEYKQATIEYGTTINPESAPTKEGYTFSGWSEIPETMPAHDVTITGSFSINKYKLTYKVDDVEYKTIEVEYGASLPTIEEPTKTGYTFTGWVGLPKTMPASDVIVIGSFSINSYKLTYVLDGVEYKTATIEYGKTISPESVPTKEGYSFSGWSGLPETMPANDVTVTGSYTINKYKILYIVDGVEYGTSEIEYGAEVNPIGEPRKEGYTFSGWLDLPEEMPAHDITVTGTFTVNKYKVTFMYGDNVLTTIEVNYGEAIELPESLNSERYTLIEWKDVPESMPAHDVVIYADYVDGINTITADSKNEQYIRVNGMYTNDMKRGVNIIRTQDGKTRKVWVK